MRRLEESVIHSPAMRLPSCLYLRIMKKEKEKVVGSGDVFPRYQGTARITGENLKTQCFIYV